MSGTLPEVLPDAMQDATPKQIADWLDDAHDLTPDAARELLRPYHGRQGEVEE